MMKSSFFPRRIRGWVRGYRPSRWKERGGIHIMGFPCRQIYDVPTGDIHDHRHGGRCGPERDPQRHRQDPGAGVHPAPDLREGTHRHRCDRGRAGKDRPPGTRVAPRSGAGRPDPQAVQARQPRGEAGTDGRPDRPGSDGRGPAVADRRGALFGGERIADDRNGAGRQEGGRPPAPRGGVEAPHLPVRLPGAGAQGIEDPAQGGRSRGDADRHRGDEPLRREGDRGICGRPPGRRAQRAELLPAEADRKVEAPHPPQVRNDDDGHRVPDERGILPVRGEPPGDPVRARDPDLRGRHAQHPRPLRDPGTEGAPPPSDHRRPVPRDRRGAPRPAHGMRRRRRRRRRTDDRGAPDAREGALRRSAVAHLREVRRHDGDAPALHRGGGSNALIRKALLPVLAAGFLLHFGYSYYQVGRGIAVDAWEVPSVLYGRPAEVRRGDHLGNIRFAERLARLSYRKVTGKPAAAGTWSEDPDRIRVYTRDYRIEETPHNGAPVEIEVRDGRVVSIASSAGAPLESIHIEPEEIGRILGPKMESRRPVALSAIPQVLQNAVIAAEDARFFSHAGIDFLGIGRAVLANLRERRFAQGGSTITQQLAKNFFLSPKKTIGRKLREAELAIVLELRYTKRQILEMYLNKIYFGQEGPQGIYGIEEAAGFYFSKRAQNLTLEESALLAGIIRSPNRYSPLREPRAAKERRNAVLARMRRLGTIREDEFRRASGAPVRTRPRRAPTRLAPYFSDYVQRIAEDALEGEKLYRTGYRFYTTLDTVHQAAAEEAVRTGLAGIANAARPARAPLQAALVAGDPATGGVTAMVGGGGDEGTQFNRAADARRQPGRAFKPFVLLDALEQAVRGQGQITLASPLSGEPLSVNTPEGSWTPGNFEGKEYGTISVRRMIEDSVNTAAVRLAMQVGLPEVVSAARDAGVASRLSPVPSLALGSFEVTPVELAYAYATFASGGRRHKPFPLEAIVGPGGETVYAGKAGVEQAVDPRAAWLVTSALEGAVERGTGR